jgi:hypothetical protein
MTTFTRSILAGAALGAMLVSASAAAGPLSRTRVVTGTHASGTQTVTRQQGGVSRDTSVTRNRDGATATSHYDRTRSDGSVSRSVEQTDFQGRTRSAQSTRTRTETGSVVTGTATGRGGNTYGLAGETTRTDTGRTSTRAVTNEEGEVVATRDAEVVREDGSVTHTVTRTGPR